MEIKSCIPVIPSSDIEKSLRLWVDGLGLTVDKEIKSEGRLIGCMVHNEQTYFWLNKRAGRRAKPEDYEGIRLYWTPSDIYETRERLQQLQTSSFRLPEELIVNKTSNSVSSCFT